MTKFFRNLFKLILIGTPWYIITNYIKNFIPNYKTRNKSKIIENSVYLSFKSLDPANKWFCNNLFFLSQSLKRLTSIKSIRLLLMDILSMHSYWMKIKIL
jgi:hypothetical protein